MNEFRCDPITGHRVIVSTARDARPNQFVSNRAVVEDSSRDDGDQTEPSCQFCNDRMETPPVVSSYGADGIEHRNQLVADWQVCVVPNLYPSLSWDRSKLREVKPDSNGKGPTPAYGYHEVVIESPTHTTSTSDLTEQQFRAMIFAYRDRMRTMQAAEGIQYVQVIKNRGKDAGASVRHTHSQIFGLPLLPEQVRREIDETHRLYVQEKQCAFCKQIEQELEIRERIVLESDEFVAWCPFASRVSYEVHVAPRSHHARFEDSSEFLLERFAHFLKQIIHRIEFHPRIDAFNYLLHSLPAKRTEESSYHWHFEILPRIAKQAGFEWGTGIYINTVAPEHAARELRDITA